MISMKDVLSEPLYDWYYRRGDRELHEDDNEVDKLLETALEDFEKSQRASTGTRYATPKTDSDIQNAKIAAVPSSTAKDTQYCTKLFNEWAQYRSLNYGDNIDKLENMIEQDLQHWLTRFILEVRKKDGSEYPANSLHHICCGIMRHIRLHGRPGLDIFQQESFADFKSVLDGEMKRLQGAGIGTKVRKAEPLTEEDEEVLWEKGLLGDHTPQSLVDTMVFMNGLYFALRSGKEHRALRFNPCQIELVENSGEKPYLVYQEDISKNNPGGLKGRRVKPKRVIHHANTQNPQRCFVRLFKIYQSRCPPNRPQNAFYLRPLTNTSGTYWFAAVPLSHNKLSSTVSRICKSAGILGFKTNHSLRTTAATRLYQSGLDEQLIMERTGHRSLDGIRSYKRTSQQQLEKVSSVLNGGGQESNTESTVLTESNGAKCDDQYPTAMSFNSCQVTINYKIL